MRVKGGPQGHLRHKKVLKYTKGQRGTRHFLFKRASEAMLKSMWYASRDRRVHDGQGAHRESHDGGGQDRQHPSGRGVLDDDLLHIVILGCRWVGPDRIARKWSERTTSGGPGLSGQPPARCHAPRTKLPTGSPLDDGPEDQRM